MLRKILLGTTVLGLCIAPSTAVQAQRYDLGSDRPLPTYNMAGIIDLDRNVQANINSANQAIEACDRAALDRALNNLREQKETLESQARSKSEFVDTARAREAASNVNYMIYQLKDGWNIQYPCGKKEEPKEAKRDYYNDADLSAYMAGGSWDIKGLPGFVGSEVPAMAATRRFGEVQPDSRGTFSRQGLGLTLPLDNFLDIPNTLPNLFNVPNAQPAYEDELDIILGINRTSATLSEVQSTYMANGRSTLLVGIGGGPSPSGYVIGAANGDVDNIMYDRDYKSTSIEAGLAKDMYMQNTDSDVRIRPYAGLGYGHSTTNEMFSGRTNAGTLDFNYTSKINTHSWEPFVGVDVFFQPEVLDFFAGTDVELSAGMRYGFQYSDIDGTDSLQVSGALNQIGMVDLNDHETSHNIKVSTGITFNPNGPINFSLGGSFERTQNAPVIMRDGVGTSNVSLDDQNVFIGTIRSTFRF